MADLVNPLIAPDPAPADGKMTCGAVADRVESLLEKIKISGQGCEVTCTAGTVHFRKIPWAPTLVSSGIDVVRAPMPTWGTTGPVQPWAGYRVPRPKGLASQAWARREVQRAAEYLSISTEGLGLTVAPGGTINLQREQDHLRHAWRVTIAEERYVYVQPGVLGAYNGGVGTLVTPLMAGQPMDSTPAPRLTVGLSYTGWIAVKIYFAGVFPDQLPNWEVVAVSELTPRGSGDMAHVPIARIIGGTVAVQMARAQIGIGASNERAAISY